MKRLIVIAVALMVSVVFGKESMALDAQGTLDVTASVANSCRVTGTTNVAFGAYDPTDAANNDAGAGDFSFRCVKNTAFLLHIIRTNTMTDGSGNNLTYELYSDAGRTALWAAAAAADPAGESPAPDNTVRTRGVYGRIPALQDVPAGNYSETVTVNVNY